MHMGVRRCGFTALVLMGLGLATMACDDGKSQTADDDNDGDMEEKDDDVDIGLPEGPAPTISDLEVTENPNNILSCYVSWQTDVSAISTVEFGEGAYRFRIRSDEVTTDHRVLVIGMHAESDYHIKAVSETTGGKGEAETTYTTGTLPEVVSVPSLGVTDVEGMQEGWTLLNLSDMSQAPPPPMVAAMYDMDGLPVWYFINEDAPDSHGDTPVDLIDGNIITVGAVAYEIPPKEIDLSGKVLWEGQPQVMREAITHHFEKLEDGTYVALREVYSDLLRGDIVEVFTADFGVMWKWNTFDYVDWVDDVTSGDWSHCNSVTVAPEEDAFYLSCRNFSNVLKVSLSGHMDIIWRLGEGGSFDSDPDASVPWFAEQHDPEIQPNGNILIYDNGTLERNASRVVEYALDTDRMRTEIVWEFPGDFDVDPWYKESWFTNYWGDADRQPNGNTLVVAGNIPGRGEASRVFEVTEDGRVVWEVSFPNNGIYRAQRLSPPPLVEKIP